LGDANTRGGISQRQVFTSGSTANSSGIVRAQEEHTVVVDNGDAKAVNPTGPAKEVPAEYWILGEEDNRRKFDAKRLDCDLVLIGSERSHHRPETLKPAGLDIQSKHLRVLALEYAMCGARIQLGYEFDRLSPNAKRALYVRHFDHKIRIVSGDLLRYRQDVHRTIDPTILYFGTPVALISTLNPDGSPNLAPMSSAWWLGWTCMLGLGQLGQTSDNLIRTRECVINLPSEDLVTHVDRLALTTGKEPVPEKKCGWGYRFEPEKFEVSGLTPVESEAVKPPRVLECPVQMEGIVHHYRQFGKNVAANVFEVHIVKLHVDDKLIISNGARPHIDPLRWRPLMMSFCRFFGLGGEVHPSRLAESDFMKFVYVKPDTGSVSDLGPSSPVNSPVLTATTRTSR
jgi:flavin reductase (DIM6/NTAB) family NADH-FMN oxidoreductase RutF